MEESLINETINFLKESNFFASIEPQYLEKIARRFEMLQIKSGKVLIHEGDPGDSIYLILSGRMRITKQVEGEAILLNESGRGELLGELALLTDEKRASTVSAIRDSLLLKLSKKDFMQFIQEYPQEIFPIIKSTILRILHPQKKSNLSTQIITFIPAGEACHSFKKFVFEFTKTLSQKSSVLHLNQKHISDFLKKENIQDNTNLIQWLNDQESKYAYIIYEADEEVTEWTKLCIRQADKIILVAMNNQKYLLNPIENELFKTPNITDSINLALLHDKTVQVPSNTRGWLVDRKIREHHHIQMGSKDSLSRFIRCITGQAIGFVFSGGGARGLSYIGVYKALRELNIPIDYAGGSSSGALFSSLFALNYTPEEIIAIFRENFIHKLLDYTLPLTSLSTGAAWAKELQMHCGDIHIEDLWKNFYCIATNMSRHRVETIDKGLLWKAIRASISLPGIVPPISNNRDELLIDGAVMNNFPVDVMRTKVTSGKIIGVNINVGSELKINIPDGVLSGWKLLFHRYKKNTLAIPRIPEIILRSILISSSNHQNEMKKQADFCIDLDLSHFKLLDFTALDKLAEIGYRTAMEKIPQFINHSDT